jgi:hypothetical protein
MGSVAGVLAGFVVIGGAVALVRAAGKRADALRKALEEIRRGAPAGAVIDCERDPSTGVFRPKR